MQLPGPGSVVSAARRLVGAAGDVRSDPVYRLESELFRTLGHPARIRLLEVLGTGEQTVGDLQEMLALDSSGVSQHLAVLRRQGLLESRKVGTTVRCRVKDPRVLTLLAIARELLMANLEDARVLLSELDAEAPPRPRRVERGQA